jgi:hypothetical protein
VEAAYCDQGSCYHSVNDINIEFAKPQLLIYISVFNAENRLGSAKRSQ